MTPDEHLQEILAEQQLDETQLEELRNNREAVEAALRAEFGSAATIRYAGSYKKGTMVRESYDLDLTFYLLRHDNSAGQTLEEIYESVYRALTGKYHVERRRSALRLKSGASGSTYTDLHIDIVPGRFTDDTKTDVFLHQENGEKGWLKTNPQVHMEHIRTSGVRSAIKLAKLWACHRNIDIKTFALELLVVKLLAEHRDLDLSEQFRVLLEEFRDRAESLSVADPANSNNDLTALLDSVRADLAHWARLSLVHIEAGSWEAVFERRSSHVRQGSSLSASLGRVAASTSPVRPWLPLP